VPLAHQPREERRDPSPAPDEALAAPQRVAGLSLRTTRAVRRDPKSQA
jgi:hypothetical protein